MIKKHTIASLFICLLLVASSFLPVDFVFADYVLPYPSYMPGNKIYRVSRAIDELKKYWYWGSIASFKYQLGLADKYLVEAKVLFEYKQYLLAADALLRSNRHIEQLTVYIKNAKDEKKDIRQLQITAEAAMIAHRVTLETLKKELPVEFLWQPEKQMPVSIPLGHMFDEALHIREQIAISIKS